MLILASRSPQRVTLMREAGYAFECDPADIDEEAYPRGLDAVGVARWLAQAKAKRVATRHPADRVLGADTVVALGDQLLGKPEDERHAERMLRSLSGSTHRVITGVALVGPGVAIVDHVESRVQMRELTDAEIADYVASGDWRGKAGGYGIQDDDPFVTCTTGSITNVIGLPMERVAELPIADCRSGNGQPEG
jgi:septum formation protein